MNVNPPPSGQQYILGGTAQGLVLTDFSSVDIYTSWTPDWYMQLDSNISTQAFPNGPGPLDRFYQMLGYETDWIRSEIESFSTLSSADYISGALLPYLGGNYGVTYEAELGMTRSRVLIKNAVQLYKTKGLPGNNLNPGGISGAASAFSGYGAVVSIGKNLEIQLDDCAFDRSVGHWTPANVLTFIEPLPVSSVPGDGPYGFLPFHALYNPLPEEYSQEDVTGYLPISNENVLRITANNDQASITTCDSSNATTLGIPCIPQATPQLVVLSAAVCPLNPLTGSLRSWFMQIDWYGMTGNYISSTEGAQVVEIVPPEPDTPSGQWVQMYVVGYPPDNAYYFGRTISSVGILDGLSGVDYHLIDAEQVEVNTQETPGPTSWEPPRDIKINLLPVRRNLVPNPVGLGGTFGWVASEGTIAASTSQSVGWPAYTESGLQITSSGGGAYQVSSIPLSLYGGQVYSLSLYLQSTQSSYNALISIMYTDGFGNQTTGPFTQIITQPGFFIQGSIPGFFIPQSTVSLSFTLNSSTAANEITYLAAPLLAPEPVVLPYFDANFLPVTDYIWEGEVNQSASDYYPSLDTRISRLITALPEYTPIGSTFSIVIAPEALVNSYGVTTMITPGPPVPPLEPPEAPTLIEAAPGDDEVILVWTP